MREINGILYGDNVSNPIIIIGVKPLQDRMMLVDFNTGERKLFDSTLLRGAVFEGLDNEAVFGAPVIDSGVVTWDDGNIDCAPEYMYANSYEYNERDILTA